MSKVYVTSIIRPPAVSHTQLQATVEKYGSSAPGMIYCITHALLRAVSIHLHKIFNHFLLEFPSYSVIRINSDSFLHQEIPTYKYSSANFWFEEHT